MRIRIKNRTNEKKRKNSNPWSQGSKYLLAMGTLAAYTAAGGSRTPAFAYAPEPPGSPQASRPADPAQGNLPVVRFDIASGPLSAALKEYQAATGISVELSRPAIADIQSPGVSGSHTAEQALRRLLSGTGVAYRFTGSNTVTLEVEQVKTAIEVSGRIAPVSSPRYTEPLRELPQTISIIPKSVMQEQGATTLSEVLRNVPGLTIAAGEGGAPAGDNLTMRGFSARNDVFVDGVRDLGPQSRDPFNLEQVEVIKGPQSAYTGRGSTGGSINLVSKQPNLSRYVGGSLMLGSAEMRRFTADVNLPLERLGMGEHTAFRMNVLAHHAGIPGRDVVESDRRGFAPSLMFGTGRPTRLSLNYFRMRQDNIPDYGIPWVPNTNNALANYRDQPAPVPRNSFYGLKSRDTEKMGSDLATVRFEHDAGEMATIRNQFRYGRSTRNSITTAPRFASNDSLDINRNGPSWITEDDVWDNQTDLKATIRTGKIEHAIATGATFTREGNFRRQRTVAGAPTTTLFSPDPDQPFNGTITMNPAVGDANADTQALFAFDTVRIGDKLRVNGGLRWERFDVSGINTNGTDLNRVDKMLSVRAGAVYNPAQNGSVYFSYGTALNPSLEGLTYQAANTTLEPEKTYTVEGGTKWDVFNDRLSLSAAIFRVEKTNARTPGVLPDDPPQVLQGEQRVAGTELGVSGFVTRRWRLYGAYTYMDSKILNSNTAGEEGKELINTPPHSFNLWTTYGIRKLELGGGARFIDRRYGNTTNTRRVDSYWTLDAMVSYPITSHLGLRLNLYNLNNAYYFERLGGGHLIPGPSRAAMISTTVQF